MAWRGWAGYGWLVVLLFGFGVLEKGIKYDYKRVNKSLAFSYNNIMIFLLCSICDEDTWGVKWAMTVQPVSD